jgi:hypothetical protein
MVREFCRATDFGTLGAEVSVLGVWGTEDTEIAKPISVARGKNTRGKS